MPLWIVLPETIFSIYIRNPRNTIAGTKVSLSGLKGDQEIVDLIGYLRGFSTDGE